jgi:hypothetical protein
MVLWVWGGFGCVWVWGGYGRGELAEAGGARQGHGAGWAPRHKMTIVRFELTPFQSIGWATLA